MGHTVGWVEIPVTDMDRAVKFYAAVLDRPVEKNHDGVRWTALLQPYNPDEVGASLTQVAGFEPNPNGALAYLNAGDDLSVMLNRVEAAGGKVVMPKTLMGEGMGYFATFTDSEGNTLALFSMN